jgi:PIN domain nuclease of toxin-antitoxin system
MRALLDAHVFLWWNAGDERLSDRARRVIADPRNEIVISVAIAWEIAIKAARGRLELPEPADTYIPRRIGDDGFESLPILLRHALVAGSLPPHHADPFDRVLIAQAHVEGMPIITADDSISRYEVETLW